MKITISLCCLFFSLLSFGQVKAEYGFVDAKMASIPVSATTSTTSIANFIQSNFKSDSDRIRAAFFWTTSNIRYDLADMNVTRYSESREDKINRALQSKKGVCSHYAAIFNELAEKMGIQSYVIEGYNKQNGKVANLAHAWNAAKIDSKWYVFDPTWGAGYVNNGKFFKKLNNSYFKVEPSKIIATHMPFDNLWQFLNYPVTNGEFYEGKIHVNKSKKYFDFEREIAKYNNLSQTDQLFESAQRIEKNGLKNALIIERYDGKKKQLVHSRKNTNIDKLNSIVSEMNEAVALLNDFIHYRNQQFKPTFSDVEINNMIQTPRQKLVKCQNDIYAIGDVGDENRSNLLVIKKSISTTLANAEEHALFVQNYLSKSKLVRKTMFSKSSWLRGSSR